MDVYGSPRLDYDFYDATEIETELWTFVPMVKSLKSLDLSNQILTAREYVDICQNLEENQSTPSLTVVFSKANYPGNLEIISQIIKRAEEKPPKKRQRNVK